MYKYWSYKVQAVIFVAERYAPINVKPEDRGGGGEDMGHLTFCDIFVLQIPLRWDNSFGQNRSNILTQNFCSIFFVNSLVIYKVLF